MAEEALLQGVETAAAPVTTEAGERIYVASQWQLMWWRFRKHHLAMAAGMIVLCFYLVALCADVLATTDPELSDAKRSLMPPQRIHWFDGWSLRPHVYAVKGARDPKTFKRVYRDLWSRLLYATRISVSIGLVGVTLSLFLGVLLGGLSGFYSGWVDTLIQRIIEIFRSIPTIPLWMGLAAALPRDWSILQVYFAITIIISLLGWTELARVVRGRFLALREEDFVVAARLAGCSQMRIIFVHMVPSFMSHIIAATTLALPAMIISETSLSFLGLGLRLPAVSWGVLLQQAQNVQTVAISPWLMLPAIPVIIAVLAFNFLGDGLRDAADPYGHAWTPTPIN